MLAMSGSSSAAWTLARVDAKAAAGSSSAGGTSPISWPMKPKNMPGVSATCLTTSTAFHPAQGDSAFHLSGGTAAILSAKRPASLS